MTTFSEPKRLAGRAVYYVRTYRRGTGSRSWRTTGETDYQAAQAVVEGWRAREAERCGRGRRRSPVPAVPQEVTA